MNYERQISARNDRIGTMTAARRARFAGIRSRQRTGVARVGPPRAARLHDAPWQSAIESDDRRPARSAVLRQDYGRRPHRCLQSGSETSRRP
jgi:hypothetical protein